MKARSWVVALSVSALAAWSLRGSRLADPWGAHRDRIQAAADAAERTGHPWAGTYIAAADYGRVGGTLCLSPDGEFYGGRYEGSHPELKARARGRAAFGGGRLTLEPRVVRGEAPALAGEYRVVRWGDIRCLIRPNDGLRFVTCLGRHCEYLRPPCTRGLVYGDPDLPEMREVRETHPGFRPFKVVSVSRPLPRSWGWAFDVELAGDWTGGMGVDDRLYWDDNRTFIELRWLRGGNIGVGEAQLGEGKNPVLGLKPGMTVSRWTTLGAMLPDFLSGIAEAKGRR